MSAKKDAKDIAIERAVVAEVKKGAAPIGSVVDQVVKNKKARNRDEAVQAVRRLVDWNKLRINDQWLLESP